MRVLSWGLLLAALHQVFVFLSVTLASREVELWFFFSSDTVQYGLLYKDLFDLGFHYAGWNISHAPEYLQMLWALLLRAVSPTLAAGHVLEAMSQPLLLAFALQHLLSRALGKRTVLAPLVVGALLTMIARGVGLDFIAFIWSNRHGFTALIAVACLATLMPVAALTSRTVWLTALVALGVVSDLLFLVWFVAPVFVAIGGAACFSPDHRSWARRATAAIVLGLGLGLLLFWMATPVITVGEKVGLDFARAWGAVGRMADDASHPSDPQRLLNALLGAGLIAAVLSAGRARRVEVRILSLYAAALPLATLAAMAITAVPFREAGYTRYLAGAELASLITLVVGTSTILGRHGEKVLLGGLAATILFGYELRPDSVAPVSRYQPPLVSCIDDVARKHGLQYGVADYWLAKYITAFSTRDLSVVPVTPRLDPAPNFTNIEWFLGGVGARRHDRPVYTFAILGSRTPEEPGVSADALRAFGPAAAIESCYGFPVHILPAGAGEKIRAQFAQNRRIREYYEKRDLPLPVP